MVDFFEQPDDVVAGGADETKSRISNYVKQVREIDGEINGLEDQIRRLKDQKDELELRKSPDALLEAGLSEIVTLEGLKVGTKLVVGAIPKDNKPTVFDWMDKNGFGSIITRQVSVGFDKGSTDAAAKAMEAIQALGLDPKQTLDVHHQTWSAFAKEQTAKGNSLPFQDWGVFYGQRATIKG